MTAVVIIGIALLVGLGLVASQLARLKRWLGTPPPPASPEEPTEL